METEEAIDTAVKELVAMLTSAKGAEAARILTRIRELEQLKAGRSLP